MPTHVYHHHIKFSSFHKWVFDERESISKNIINEKLTWNKKPSLSLKWISSKSFHGTIFMIGSITFQFFFCGRSFNGSIDWTLKISNLISSSLINYSNWVIFFGIENTARSERLSHKSRYTFWDNNSFENSP